MLFLSVLPSKTSPGEFSLDYTVYNANGELYNTAGELYKTAGPTNGDIFKSGLPGSPRNENFKKTNYGNHFFLIG